MGTITIEVGNTNQVKVQIKNASNADVCAATQSLLDFLASEGMGLDLKVMAFHSMEMMKKDGIRWEKSS